MSDADSCYAPDNNEERLRVDEERFRLIEENVRDYAIFMLDTLGNISTWNIGAERILGYRDDEILGQQFAVLFTPEDRQKRAPETELSQASKNGRAEDVRWHLRKDGTTFWANGILTVLLDRHGKHCGFVKILRDSTERKAAEERAVQHKEEVEALNTKLKSKMSETHHRVKNNLQVITALLDMKIMEGEETVSVSELKRLRLHIRALASIHEMLTQVVKADSDVSEISTLEMMGHLQPMLVTSIGDRPIELDVEDIGLPTRYGSSLAMLVNEIVTNAMKHGGGKILVTLRHDGQMIRLDVSDEGPGFPEGFSPRIHAHTGIDLIESLSRWDLKGEVTFSNRPESEGHGGRVVVTFPRPHEVDWKV
jgi:PAS domain S-box-containing protein